MQARSPFCNRSPIARQEAALIYAARGWPMFPVSPGKKPLTEHGLLDASLDEKVILAWLERWPEMLIAIATGEASGVVALDVDFRPEGNGRNTLEYELEVYFPLTTPIAHSPSGGYHILFAWPGHDVSCSAGKLGRFLDVRGDRGSLILPPGPGRWWDPAIPWTTPLAPCRRG